MNLESVIDEAWLKRDSIGAETKGEVRQLYRYVFNSQVGKKLLYATPEISHGLHGVNLLDPVADTI